MIGTRQEVLLESENKNGLMQGFTSNYIKFVSNYNEELAGRLSAVTILESNAEHCTGSISLKKSIDLVTS